jgi:hypothetical protein
MDAMRTRLQLYCILEQTHALLRARDRAHRDGLEARPLLRGGATCRASTLRPGPPSIRSPIRDLAAGHWIAHGDNVPFLGPFGVGPAEELRVPSPNRSC